MSNLINPEVVYLIGDLKRVFARVRSERVKAMQAEPFPEDSKCLADTSPCQALAIDATKSLELLKNFADSSYIALNEVPCELADSSNEGAKPFHTAYVAGKYHILTATEAAKYTSALRTLE